MPANIRDATLRLRLRAGKSVDATIRLNLVNPIDFEQIVVSTVVKTLTAAKVSPAMEFPSIKPVAAFITVEGQPIRYRIDSSAGNPTAAIGHLGAAGDFLYLTGDAIKNFRCIRQGGSDATIHVTYLKE